MIGLILIGYALALILGIINLLIAVGTTALGIAYSKAFKGQALLGNFDRGLLGMCAVAFGAVASSTITWSLLLPLLLMVLCHDSSTNLVGAMRDREGDGNAGYKTVPVIYGMGRAVDIACALVLMGCVCGAILLVLAAPVPLALIFFLAAILIELLVYISLASTRARVSRLQALWAHKMLVYERLTLLSAFIAIFLPVLGILLIFGSTIAATAVSQKLLRDRYEQSAFGSDVKKETEGALHEITRS